MIVRFANFWLILPGLYLQTYHPTQQCTMP